MNAEYTRRTQRRTLQSGGFFNSKKGFKLEITDKTGQFFTAAAEAEQIVH